MSKEQITAEVQTQENLVVATPNSSTPEQVRQLVFTQKEFTSGLNKFSKLRSQGKILAHSIAMQGLYRAFGHDNYDYVKQFMVFLDSNEQKQLKAWLKKYSPIRLVTGGKEKFTFRKDTSPNAKPFNFEDAYLNPFHKVSLKDDDDVNALLDKIFNTSDLKRILKQATKKIEKGIENAPEDQKAFMQAIVEHLTGELMVRIPDAPSNDTVKPSEAIAA